MATGLTWTAVAVLYLGLLGEDSLRNNEFITLRVIELDYPTVLTDRVKRNHMPVYFLGLKLWAGMFGSGQIAIRLPSALFGLAGIFAVWRLGVRFFGRGYGVFVLLICGLNTTLLHASTEARMYSAVFFFSASMLWAYIAWVEEGKLRFLVLLFLLGSVGLYVHLLIFLVLIPLLAWTVLERRQLPGPLWQPLSALAGPMAMVSPLLLWWFGVQDQLGFREVTIGWENAASLQTALRLFFGDWKYVEPQDVRILSALLGVVCIAVTGVALSRGLRSGAVAGGVKRYAGLLWFIVLLVVVATGVASSGAKYNLFKPRYYIMLAAIAPLLVTWTAVFLDGWGRQRLAAAYAVCVAMLLAVTTIAFVADPGLGVREAARSLAERRLPGDVAIVSACSQRNRGWVYYGALESRPICPLSVRRGHEELLDWLRVQIRDERRFWVIYKDSPWKSRDGEPGWAHRISVALDEDPGVSRVGEIQQYGKTYLGLYERPFSGTTTR